MANCSVQKVGGFDKKSKMFHFRLALMLSCTFVIQSKLSDKQTHQYFSPLFLVVFFSSKVALD